MQINEKMIRSFLEIATNGSVEQSVKKIRHFFLHLHPEDFVGSAMSKVENGTPAVITDVIAGWELFQKHKP